MRRCFRDSGSVIYAKVNSLTLTLTLTLALSALHFINSIAPFVVKQYPTKNNGIKI